MTIQTRSLVSLAPTFLALAAAAQQAGSEPRPSAAAQQVPTLSIDFRGGTLPELAIALRQAGQNVNIVLPESAAQVRVPPLVLRQTTVEAALRALATVVDPGVRLHVETSIGTRPNTGPIGEPVYSIHVRHQAEPSAAGGESPERQVRVLALRPFIKPANAGEGDAMLLDVKTILTAVDTGLSVVAEQAASARAGRGALGDTPPEDSGGAGQKAVVRYHEDSGLLFVAGTMTQLRVVEEVINSLDRQIAQERSARKTKTAAPAADKAADEPVPEDKKKATR